MFPDDAAVNVLRIDAEVLPKQSAETHRIEHYLEPTTWLDGTPCSAAKCAVRWVFTSTRFVASTSKHVGRIFQNLRYDIMEDCGIAAQNKTFAAARNCYFHFLHHFRLDSVKFAWHFPNPQII